MHDLSHALSYYKWSPRTVYGRIIGPLWDHPRRRKQSPLTKDVKVVPLVVHYRQSTMKRGSIDWSLSDANRRPVMHDTLPRPSACYKYNEPACIVLIPIFTPGIHYADSSSMGVVSSPLPAETSADVASPCFDRTGSVQSAPGGPSAAGGGPGMAAIFGPGGPIILPHTWTVRGDRFRGPRGDCPRRDSSISFPHFRFLFLHFRFSFLISSFLLLVVTLVPTFSSTRLEVLIYNCTDTDFSREL